MVVVWQIKNTLTISTRTSIQLALPALQINNLQVLDGAAAKVVVLALEGSNRETQVLLAWPSASTPAAAAKDQQALPPGVTISAQTDMCLGPASLAPRNSSDTAQSAAGSVRFTHPGA